MLACIAVGLHHRWEKQAAMGSLCCVGGSYSNYTGQGDDCHGTNWAKSLQNKQVLFLR